jgi:hypothetical protein
MLNTYKTKKAYSPKFCNRRDLRVVLARLLPAVVDNRSAMRPHFRVSLGSLPAPGAGLVAMHGGAQSSASLPREMNLVVSCD